MGDITYVEGVPNRDASRYSREYMKIMVKLLEISPEHVDVPEKLISENLSVSRYVKLRHILQTDYQGALMQGNMEQVDNISGKITALRDPSSYIRDDFLGTGLFTPGLGNSDYARFSLASHYIGLHEDHTRNHISLPHTAEYAYLSGRN
jgi:hypothetical protein